MKLALPDGTPTPLTLHEARLAIEQGRFRRLTADVFDTLVWRPVAQPHHLFIELGRELAARGFLRNDIDPAIVATARKDAERHAREASYDEYGSPECTIEEIWERVSPELFRDDPQIAELISIELDVESRTLRPHPAANRLLAAAHDAGVPITLVSDMYLSPTQLRDLLGRAGVDVHDVEIVTSSARRQNKWEGLLAEVLGGDAGQSLHIGDNPYADVVAAQRAGATACFVAVDPPDAATSVADPKWEAFSLATGSDGGRDAAIRETLVTSDMPTDPSYQFGVAIAGPVMTGFAAWASSQAAEAGASAIHCLLREGSKIADLIDIVDPDGPDRVRVHASRWAIMRAAVVHGTAGELERSLSRRANLSAEHVADAFGLDAERVQRTLGARVVARSEQRRAFNLLASDRDLMADIVAESRRIRHRVMTYLRANLRMDDGPLVICDIGWGGTIQEGLTDILNDAGIDTPVIGLYSLLSPPGQERVARGAQMRCYLPTIGPDGTAYDDATMAVRHPEFLERINTPAIGTLLDFEDDGTPICRPDDHDVINESLSRAQQGVIDYASTFAAMIGSQPDLATRWSAGDYAQPSLAALAAVITGPDPRLAESLGSWEHDDVAGAAAESLANPELQRWIGYTNAVDASALTMHDTFWVAGVAGAGNPTLSTGLAALASGADHNAVSPSSPTGLARIAVFEPGSDLATGQVERTPRLGEAGWMLLQLKAPVAGVRSIRIDVGAIDLLVDIGDVEVVLRRADHAEHLVDGPDRINQVGRWIGGRWIGPGQAVVSAGGHLLIDPPQPGDATGVEVSIGFRAWPINPETRDHLLPRWRTAIEPRLTTAKRRVQRLTER